ncbi:MAG: LysM peptidoglycan-binding domain-containing protein [Clostridiales bacterium]|nr:LysM peptidoglycan-binding domain-containing protein [Clostridiales bacterium]
MERLNAVRRYGRRTDKKLWNKKLIIAFVAATLVLVIGLIIPTKIAYANQDKQNERLYKTIEIKQGDSLWSIAKENYTEECNSMNDYIYLIKKCNSLYVDELTAGCYLVVPYYSAN